MLKKETNDDGVTFETTQKTVTVHMRVSGEGLTQQQAEKLAYKKVDSEKGLKRSNTKVVATEVNSLSASKEDRRFEVLISQVR